MPLAEKFTTRLTETAEDWGIPLTMRSARGTLNTWWLYFSRMLPGMITQTNGTSGFYLHFLLSLNL